MANIYYSIILDCPHSKDTAPDVLLHLMLHQTELTRDDFHHPFMKDGEWIWDLKTESAHKYRPYQDKFHTFVEYAKLMGLIRSGSC